MMKHIIKHLKQLKKSADKQKNAGSTMVEVLAGFTILVIVIVECMVHIVSTSGSLVQKSRDVQEDIRVLNEEMYKKTTTFTEIPNVNITLTVDADKTDDKNLARAASVKLNASVSYYDSDKADLRMYRIISK